MINVFKDCEKFLIRIFIIFWMSTLFFLATEVVAAERGIVPVPVQASPVIVKKSASPNFYKGSYALVIGVSDYKKGWPDLPGVAADVKEVKLVLEKNGFRVTVVNNPTKKELDEAFGDFISHYGLAEGNRLLVYFAGHGHTQKLSYGGQMGYLVPADAPSPKENLNGFLSSGLDMQQIEVYAKRIQARHALFLFDSCFSGSIFSLNRSIPRSVQHKIKLPVRQFIASGSAGEQVSDESVFRKMFVAALNGEGDLNQDGFLTGAELGEFLKNKVIDYTKGSQHPQYGTIRDPNLDKGDFVFFLNSDRTPFYSDNVPSSSDENRINDQRIEAYKKELTEVKQELIAEEKKLEFLRNENKEKKAAFDEKKKWTRRLVVTGKAKKIGSWIVFKNGTAVDTRTRLMWMTQDFYNFEGKSPQSQEEALAWVDKVNSEKRGGYSDWRIPRVNEYRSIFNKRLDKKGFEKVRRRGAFRQRMDAKPVGYPNVFENGGGYWYWTSDFSREEVCGLSTEIDSTCVKTFNFRNGQTTIRDTNRGDFFSSSVRLVRDFQ